MNYGYLDDRYMLFGRTVMKKINARMFCRGLVDLWGSEMQDITTYHIGSLDESGNGNT